MTLTHARAREMFDYDPITGWLTWRKETRGRRHLVGDRAGHRDPSGYRQLIVDRRHYSEHRLIWLWMTGAWPKHTINHKNYTRDDNRWDNLEDVHRLSNIVRPGKYGRSIARRKERNGRIRWVYRPNFVCDTLADAQEIATIVGREVEEWREARIEEDATSQP